ncbi:hypothetical protein [Phycicoccus flavus]|uniref:hypothetical protein n=1 Tax=Phycicoccus flavus TaxID=2502783 RepID=UPI000FEBFC17|nr:hypothetical protein [Phycicoccus flavus]NHA69165.1 hypothetical protein [Phycicoccus flavus]
MEDPEHRTRGPWVATSAVLLWVAALAALVILGADLMWVVSFGDAVRADGTVPAQVPNLVAPQADWPNPVVLAELLLSCGHSLGRAGLAGLHLLIVAATLLVVVGDGRRAGGRDVRLAVAVSLLVAGASATLVVVRFPSLSLLPFVVLVALLRAWDRGHRRALWLVPPLMVLWGNLHGAVLVGLAVLGVFVLAAGRRDLLLRVGAGLLSLLALVATSAGLRTPEYYVSALGNEAAARGTDLWSRPSLTHPLDVVLLLAALLLLLGAARSLRLWEWLVVAGLVVGTASAARHGVWLLLFLAPVASVAAGTRLRESGRWFRPTPRAVLSSALAGTVALGGVGTILDQRAEWIGPPGESLVPILRQAAGDGTVLAVEPAAETFAQQGLQVWVANPIDAFDGPTQVRFLDFLHDCRVPAVELVAVVVQPRCVDQVTAQGWTETVRRDGLVLLER